MTYFASFYALIIIERNEQEQEERREIKQRLNRKVSPTVLLFNFKQSTNQSEAY